MILIIGGTGFIGKHLSYQLAKSGKEARIMSRSPDQGFLREHAPMHQTLTYQAFLADPAKALKGCDSVVYLASASTPGAFLNRPWREASNNVDPAMRIMTNVARHSDAHLVYLSSGGTVYGQTDGQKILETTPLNPISPYGIGKQMIEAALHYIGRTTGLTYTILRPANPIGIWQQSNAQGLVGVLMRAAATGAEFTMIGDGSAVRDYFDVTDLVAAILSVVENPAKSAGQIWNVGSGQGCSTREMIDLVERTTGRKIAVTQAPNRPTDVPYAVLDISAIEHALGWRPMVPLDQSLAEIWQSTRAAVQKPSA